MSFFWSASRRGVGTEVMLRTAVPMVARALLMRLVTDAHDAESFEPQRPSYYAQQQSIMHDVLNNSWQGYVRCWSE